MLLLWEEYEEVKEGCALLLIGMTEIDLKKIFLVTKRKYGPMDVWLAERIKAQFEEKGPWIEERFNPIFNIPLKPKSKNVEWSAKTFPKIKNPKTVDDDNL